jgi:hypothetical protein
MVYEMRVDGGKNRRVPEMRKEGKNSMAEKSG